MNKLIKQFFFAVALLLAFVFTTQAQTPQHLYFNIGGAGVGSWLAWNHFDRTLNSANVALVDLAGNPSFPVANYGSLLNPAPEAVYQAYNYYLAQGVRVGMQFTTADGIVANRIYLMRVHIWQNTGFDSPTPVSVWLQGVSKTGYTTNNNGNALIIEYAVTAQASGEILYEMQAASLPVFPTAVEFIEQSGGANNSDSRKGGMFFGM